MTPAPSIQTCLSTLASFRAQRDHALLYAAHGRTVEEQQRGWRYAGRLAAEARAWQQRAEMAAMLRTREAVL